MSKQAPTRDREQTVKILFESIEILSREGLVHSDVAKDMKLQLTRQDLNTADLACVTDFLLNTIQQQYLYDKSTPPSEAIQNVDHKLGVLAHDTRYNFLTDHPGLFDLYKKAYEFSEGQGYKGDEILPVTRVRNTLGALRGEAGDANMVPDNHAGYLINAFNIYRKFTPLAECYWQYDPELQSSHNAEKVLKVSDPTQEQTFCTDHNTTKSTL